MYTFVDLVFDVYLVYLFTFYGTTFTIYFYGLNANISLLSFQVVEKDVNSYFLS